MPESLDLHDLRHLETQLITVEDQDRSRLDSAANYLLGLSGKARQAMAIGTSLLAFGGTVTAYEVSEISVASADVPSANVAKANQRINNLADNDAVTMARQILTLAKDKPRSVKRVGNSYTDEVGVTVNASTTPGYALYKGGSTNKYTLYADIPAPANARYADRRKLSPGELSELNPRNVVGLYLNEGYSTQLAFEDPAHDGWIFRGGYMFSPNGSYSVIRASTNPTLPHEQTLTASRLKAANDQAEQLIEDATADSAIGFLPKPAFRHHAGENDGLLPPF